MPFEYLSVVRDGPLTIVTIEREAVHNALNTAAQYELEAVFDAFSADDDQWVAILTGAGTKAFCAGHDLKQQAGGGGLDIPATGFAGLTSRFNLCKPVIAAVNGAAMGGGFEIALACDLIVASENASFALPEPRVGLAALASGFYRLPRELGLKQAMGLMLTGRRLSARDAFALGLVNEVVPAGEALDGARKWAGDIIAASPLSVRATKEAVLRGYAMDLEAAIREQWEFPALKRMLASEDAIEGPKAFAEKRVPVWKGR